MSNRTAEIIRVQILFRKDVDVKYPFPFHYRPRLPDSELLRVVINEIRDLGYEGDIILTFMDDDGDYVVFDSDSCAEAMKFALKNKSISIRVENFDQLTNKFLPRGAEKQLFGAGLPETAFVWLHYLSSKIKSEVKEEISSTTTSSTSKKSHDSSKKMEKKNDLKIPRRCTSCQVEMELPYHFVCLEEDLEKSIFCFQCGLHHNSDHVMLKVPVKFTGNRGRITEAAFYAIHSLKRYHHKKEKSSRKLKGEKSVAAENKMDPGQISHKPKAEKSLAENKTSPEQAEFFNVPFPYRGRRVALITATAEKLAEQVEKSKEQAIAAAEKAIAAAKRAVAAVEPPVAAAELIREDPVAMATTVHYTSLKNLDGGGNRSESDALAATENQLIDFAGKECDVNKQEMAAEDVVDKLDHVTEADLQLAAFIFGSEEDGAQKNKAISDDCKNSCESHVTPLTDDDVLSQYSCLSSTLSDQRDFELYSSVVVDADNSFNKDEEVSAKDEEGSYVIANSIRSSRESTFDDDYDYSDEMEIVPFNVNTVGGVVSSYDENSTRRSSIGISCCIHDVSRDNIDDETSTFLETFLPPSRETSGLVGASRQTLGGIVSSLSDKQKQQNKPPQEMVELIQFNESMTAEESTTTNQQRATAGRVIIESTNQNDAVPVVVAVAVAEPNGVTAAAESAIEEATMMTETMLEHKSEPSNMKPIYVQEIREETPSISCRSDSFAGSSIQNNDKFTEFLSKILVSTSHAFENVSVASSQAFAVVSDAVDALRSASNNTPPLPTPRVSKKWEPPEQEAGKWQPPPANKWQPPQQAWVPKGTQTLWDDPQQQQLQQPQHNEEPQQQQQILTEDDKYLTSMIQKNRTLKELGFFNESRNAQLLIEKNGDLDEIIEILLSENNN